MSSTGFSHLRYLSTALAALLLFACVGPTMRSPDFSDLELAEEKSRQRVEYVRQLVQEQERIARVAYRLSVGTLALCRGEETLVTGAYMFDWDLTSDEWVDIANQALGINLHTPGIEVLFVIPDSPAETAGIRAGDRIVRLNEWRVPSKRGAFTEFYRKLRLLNAAKASSIDLRIQREARFVDVTLYPVEGCDFPVVLQEDESMNAFSDGEKVMINRGMLRFTRNDDELALIITHEMAHNILDHVDAKRKNMARGASVGVVVDILLASATGVRTNTFQQVGAGIGALAYSKDFEREADYYSAYLMAQAGFDVSVIPGYWRYISSVDQKSMKYSATHPTSVERSLHMSKTVEEIERRRRADQPPLADHSVSAATSLETCITAEDIQALNKLTDESRIFEIDGVYAKVFLALDPRLLSYETEYAQLVRQDINKVVAWKIWGDLPMASAALFADGCLVEGYGEPDWLNKLQLMHEAVVTIAGNGLNHPPLRDIIRQLLVSDNQKADKQTIDAVIDRIRRLLP